MAQVTQCDVCGTIIANEDAMYVKLLQCNSDGLAMSKTEVSKDVCNKCYIKILNLLNKSEEKENGNQ